MGVDNFDKAIAVVLRDEGGYECDPNDPGGETNFGISKRSYPDIDIKSLTIDDAKAIYKRDFWDNNGYGRIIDPSIATKVFDMAVNMGPREANTLLQRALVTIGADIVVDGDLGPKSLAAINASDPAILLVVFRTDLIAYYMKLITLHPSDKEFIKGWLRRVHD